MQAHDGRPLSFLLAPGQARRFAAAERDVWIDWDDIPSTAAWWAEIVAAIEATDAFVFPISPDAVASQVCAEELAHAQALALAKRLVPVVVREAVPAALRALNWIFLRAEHDFDTGVKTLLTALDTDLEWLRAHTRLLVRGGDWQRHGEDPSYLLRGADLEVARRWREGAAGRQPQPAPLLERYGALITATRDGRVREFDATTLAERHVQQHPGRVWQAVLSHDQSRLATAVHGEPLARVWRRGAKAPEQLPRLDAQVRTIAFSSDDARLVTGSDDGRLLLWSLADGSSLWQARRGGIVWCAAIDKTGRRVASVADDGDLVVHDAASGAEPARLAQGAVPSEIAFSPGGRWLALRFS
ncbi:toll/interleukin-1 receptor domain-containing protein [Rubrivivax gelatinosus]|uniref:WD domain G-beta repeat uncharacterized protein n=1 Tax=Rubrivivax gelatinosus TaxID=28068 RepID=A0A4R2MD72_RUBGE|nr:TIR domain-containing protein [Rubrivivax gelatinosus]MBK1688866.1 hypothetical protein [Rubrivivax gelatinosus]TCP03095.1 WD domain G-beta repeat uncharacterized protein [Rubrivivax gelatinosus]